MNMQGLAIFMSVHPAHIVLLAAGVDHSPGAVPVRGAINTTAIGSSTSAPAPRASRPRIKSNPKRDNLNIPKHGHEKGCRAMF